MDDLETPHTACTLTVIAKDPAGNVRQAAVAVTVMDPTKRVFTSDATGQLTEDRAVATGARARYTYDALGHLTQVATQAAGAPGGVAGDLAGLPGRVGWPPPAGLERGVPGWKEKRGRF